MPLLASTRRCRRQWRSSANSGDHTSGSLDCRDLCAGSATQQPLHRAGADTRHLSEPSGVDSAANAALWFHRRHRRPTHHPPVLPGVKALATLAPPQAGFGLDTGSARAPNRQLSDDADS